MWEVCLYHYSGIFAVNNGILICFGEMAEVGDIFIVFEIFAGVLVIFTFWLRFEKPND